MDLVAILVVLSAAGSLLAGIVLSLQGELTTITTGVGILHALACGSLARREKGDPHYSLLLIFMGGSLCMRNSSMWPSLLTWLPSICLGAVLTPPLIECDEYGETNHVVAQPLAHRLHMILTIAMLVYACYTVVTCSQLLPEDWQSVPAMFMIWLPLLSIVILAICWTRGTEPYKRT